jgi:hypothetical protein
VVDRQEHRGKGGEDHNQGSQELCSHDQRKSNVTSLPQDRTRVRLAWRIFLETPRGVGCPRLITGSGPF